MLTLTVFHGEAMARYGFPEPHPFACNRQGAFWAEFTRRGLPQRVNVAPPAACAEEDLLAFHTPEHVRRVKRLSAQGRAFLDAGDTPAFPGAFEAACTVVGTSLAAMEAALAGGRAFNPIGGLHHARRDAAAGFCVMNDIGVVIEKLRARGIRRIGYADIDVHHGDGVFYAYEADPDVLIADIHQDGRTLYPGTGFPDEAGTGKAKGTKLNLPLPPGAGEREFLEAFAKAERFLEASRPEFLILQCGADGLAGDPLAQLRLTPECHRQAAERLRALADRHAGGRLLALGGGGYDLGNLARAWCAVAEALA